MINYHEVISFLVYITVSTEEHAYFTIHIEPIQYTAQVHVTKIMHNFLKNCLERIEQPCVQFKESMFFTNSLPQTPN